MKKNNILSNIFAYVTVFVFMIAISTFSVSAAQSAVNLGSAGNFVILAKSGVSTTGTTSIIGGIGVSPIDSTGITGFGLIMDSSNQFATSSLVTGKIYASDYTPPTPAVMTTAISDMQTAYTDAAGRTLPDKTELGAGDISGMTLTPGLYKWGTGVLINNGVTLSGGANDVWIFQIAQDLTVGNGAIIHLSGGAQAKNIFWQVAGQATLGTTSDFKGNILSQTAIILGTGATLNGRALAQTAVTLDANAVTVPSGSSTPNPNPTPTGGSGSGSGSSNGNSSSSGSSSGSQCTDWSTCDSTGTRTRTCTESGSTSKSIYTQACTPTQTNVTNQLKCEEWSTCGSDGTQTRTCTQLNTTPSLGDAGKSPDVSIQSQACTPTQTNTTQTTDTGNNGQNTVTTGQNNNGNTPVGGTTQSGYTSSWWSNFTSWISKLFGGK